MATFTWQDGNQGIYYYGQFQHYSIVRMAGDKLVFRYDDSTIPLDPTLFPRTIVMTIENGQILENDEGTSFYSAGTVTGIKYRDASNNLLIEARDLDLAVSPITRWVADGQAENIQDYILSGDHRFFGSADSQGPDWDGDEIQTGTGNDFVKSRGGGDFVRDAGGADHYDLGGGRDDTLTYEYWFDHPAGMTGGVTVNLTLETALGPDGHRDTVIGVERVRGTFLDDKLVGDGADNELMGLQGNDILNGQGGFDTVDYRKEASHGGHGGVRVNLSTGEARDSFQTVDTLVSIEAVEGTEFRDFMIANRQDNLFQGRGGADRFIFQGQHFGDNLIRDFSQDEGDLIYIRHADRLSDLTITYDGASGDALIEYGSGSITLSNWVSDNPGGELVADDFVF